VHSGTPEKRPKKEPACEHITFNKTSAFNVYSTMLNSAFEDLVPRPLLGLCPRTPTTNGTSFKTRVSESKQILRLYSASRAALGYVPFIAAADYMDFVTVVNVEANVILQD